MLGTSEPSIDIKYRMNSPQLRFAGNRLAETLRTMELFVTQIPLQNSIESESDVLIMVAAGDADTESIPTQLDISIDPSIRPEGFQIACSRIDDKIIYTITAQDETGGMYGVLEFTEQVMRCESLTEIPDIKQNPDHHIRAIKFNLPWSPYRAGEHNNLQLDTCRDLGFWQEFLDMMAENRFNVLSLWNLHPFAYMVKSESFPEACPFTDEELADWQSFWHSLFKMAHNRGIDVYLLNWNIVVSPSFSDTYDVAEHAAYDDVVKQYTREVVTQTINEYEGIDGIGFCLGEWMGNPVGREMTPGEREEWIEDTIIAGMDDADRDITLVHRSAVTGSVAEMRETINDAVAAGAVGSVTVPTKFNWSHGHSTPHLELTHDYSSGEVDETLWDPEPTDYNLTWMVRNEDFFVLRWGDPKFIREHIDQNSNDKSYISGYFVGSEGFLPAQDYSHTSHKHKTWQYAFQKQWLFYTLWGRLLYDVDTPDEVFESAFDQKYSKGVGEDLLTAFSLASRMPLRLASFYAATWDYTLYAECFLAPEPSPFALEDRRDQATSSEIKLLAQDGQSSFISIDDLIYHQPLDSGLLSIPEFVEARFDDETPPSDSERLTPLELADELEDNGCRALELATNIRTQLPQITIVDGFHLDTHQERYVGALECEIADVKTWAHLSMYFAKKLRAGVALESFRVTGRSTYKESAINRLKTARDHWTDIVRITDDHYQEIPYRKRESISWKKYQNDVDIDIEIAKRATAESRFD